LDIGGGGKDIKMKESSRELEKIYRLAIENSTSGIYIFQDGKFVFVNKAMKHLSGYTREELLSINYLDLIHSDYRDKMERMTKQALTGDISGLPPRPEFKAIRKDGKERWVENIPTIIQYRGRPAILGNIVDITERKKMEDRLKKSKMLCRELGKAVNLSENINELSEKILKALNNIIDYDLAALLVYNPEENTLTPSARVGYPEDLEERTIKKQKVEKSKAKVAAYSALIRKPVFIDNMKEHELTRYVYDLCEKYNLHQMYTLPLISRGGLQGALQIVVKEDKILSNEDIESLDTLSEEIAAGISKIKTEEKLRILAHKDYLTGLYNYRFLQQKLDEQRSRSERYGEIYSVIYLDIDNFKACNDIYGHAEGDKVLKILSNILSSNLRKMDSAYRYGGEEFVILLPYTYKEKAKQVAERIRKEIYRRLYPKYKITMSMGVADSKIGEDVIGAADKAMYAAKREGKNKVKVAGGT